MYTLTTQQEIVKAECLAWLRNPKRDDKFRVLRGFAGSGKTFLIKVIIHEFREGGLSEEFNKDREGDYQNQLDAYAAGFLSRKPTKARGAIAGAAPTHNAKDVLSAATGGAIDDYATVQSLFSLQLKLVKFTKADQQRLDILQKTENLTEAEEKQRDSLILQRQSAEKKKRELYPTGRLNLTGIRLIVVDECSMLGEFLVSQILKAAYDDNAHPDLQILFMGDPFQLPPVGEIDSKVFNLTTFPELTEIVRYGGSILKYAEAIRERPVNLNVLHHAFLGQCDDLASINYRDAIVQGAAMIEGGKNIMFIAATNKAVDSINQALRRRIKGEDSDYVEGDKLLTREAVERRKCLGADRIPNCKFGRGNYCTSCDLEDTEIGTSTFLTITEILERDTYVTPLGSTLRRTKCFVRDEEQNYATPVYLCHIDDSLQWAEDISTLQSRVNSFFSRSKKNKRGQEGDAAKEVWKKEGLKNWLKKLNGEELTDKEYNQIRGRYFRDLNECKEAFDNVSLGYCATINRMQGVTVDIVALHTPSIFKSLKFSGQAASAWDPYRLLYTAATRAAKQLVLIE